jgi:hypothetical protein
MTSALKPRSDIVEPPNVALEVMFITRRVLSGHALTSQRTEKTNAAAEGAIRLFGLQTLAAPVFYRESSSQIERAIERASRLGAEIWQSAPRSQPRGYVIAYGKVASPM